MSSPRRSSGLGPGSSSRFPEGAPANGAPEEDLENDGDPEADEGEGEDLMDDNMLDDYKAIPELDAYEEEGLGSDSVEAMDPAARAAAERQMRKRDLEESKRMGRGPAALHTPEADDDEDQQRPRQRRRISDGADDMPSDQQIAEAEALARLEERTRREARERARDQQEDDEEEVVDLDEYAGPLADFLALPRTRAEIRKRFRTFISEYKEDNSRAPIYPARINTMCNENKASLEVSFIHLSNSIPRCAVWVADAPELMLSILDEEALDIALFHYPNYAQVHPSVHVRITNLPVVDQIRELRQIHLNSMVKVEGVVTRRTAVYPQLQVVNYNCARCGDLVGPFTQNENEPVKPGRCPQCQSTGPFNLNSQQTVYRNYQKVTLQESPGSVPAGRVPRTKDVILLHDLIDTVSPGELVEITGIYKHSFEMTLNTQNGFPVFNTVILANYISKSAGDIDRFKLSDEDVQQIQKYAAQKNIAELIFNSVGPSIFGHENIKIALALAMFGGEPKEFENKHRIRGDINVLILGDPGTAKSQFLKYVEKTSNRAVYTTGKGASAVGLTASVHADPVTREWTLEGGALVLADQGICLIDEFDKMNDQDRTSIHEAMEQQSISISKAGIIATLKARCAVVAAANPISGRYDSSKSFIENVELTDAILSRFDCLCVVRDTVDHDVDRQLADFVISSHMKSHPLAEHHEMVHESETDGVHEMNRDLPQLPQSLLRKYITYARQNYHPKLTNIDDDKIARLYSDLRRESLATGGIPIAVRHIESMIRMSEAHAKLHLRDHVTEDDVNMAIRIMLESFISTQKFSVMRSLRKHFLKYTNHNKDSFELLLHTLNQLVQEVIQLRLLKRRTEDVDAESEELEQTPVEIPMEEFEQKAEELNISNLDPFFKSSLFSQHGYSLDHKAKAIIKQA